jgi:hypothetical protein
VANTSSLSSFEPLFEDYKGIFKKNGNEGQLGCLSVMLWVFETFVVGMWWFQGCWYDS